VGKSERHFGTNDDHCTPPEIFEPIVRVWGGIAFDPCHSPASRVPARIRIWLPKWYEYALATGRHMTPPYTTLESGLLVGDGLLANWDVLNDIAPTWPGYYNGPYSHLEPWNQKSSEQGRQVIALQPARTGSGYWRDWVWPFANAVCFLERGQVFESFGKPVVNTNEKSKSFGKSMNTPWHSVLIYWGENLDAFRAAFDDAGEVVEL